MFIKQFILSLFVLVLLCPGAQSQTFVSTIVDNSTNKTIVFIHGFTSNARDGWTESSSSTYWPELFSLGGDLSRFNSAVVDYGSTLRDGQDIDSISRGATAAIQRNISPFSEIIFVGHSLGGIIARNVILEDPAIANRTLALVTLGTPMGGSNIANWARAIGFRGPVILQLQNSADGNYVASLAQEWNTAQRQMRIPVYCGSEGRSLIRIDGIGLSLVVSQSSAWLTCTRDLMGFPRDDHSSLSKPEGQNDDLHTWLMDILRQY